MNLSDIIQQIDERKKELDALRPISPEREAKIKQTFRLWWNYHSNAIEGNQLTLGETISLILHDLTAKGKSYKDHREVKGHNEALLWVDDIVKDNRPITQNFIREMHEMILKEPYDSPAITPLGETVQKKIKIGQYKTTPNHVRTPTGEIYHYALPEEVPAKIDDLLRWYEQEKRELHPLILAATFHYRFVKIHPFDDGNGRMSRILMNLVLMQGNYPPAIIKMEKRNEYLAALSEADAGNLDKFILFVGENLLESIDLYVRGAKGEIITEADDLDKKIALLKLQLKNQSQIDDAPIQKSIEVQRELFEKSLKPLFIKAQNKLSQFDDFFIDADNYIMVDGFLDRENTIELAKKHLKNKVSRIKIAYQWKGFKFNNVKPFNFGKEVRCDLDFFNYKLYTTNSRENPIEKIYGQQLTENEINQIVITATEEVLNEIQEKTNTNLSG